MEWVSLKTLSEKVKETSSNLIHWGQKLSEIKFLPRYVVDNKVVLFSLLLVVVILLLWLICSFIFLNQLLTWFVITAVFCYYMYFRLNTSKNETWKHFLKIFLTFLVPFVLTLAALLIFQYQSKGKIFIEVVLIEKNSEVPSDLYSEILVEDINSSYQKSEDYIDSKFSNTQLSSAPNTLELNSSSAFFINVINLIGINQRYIKCIINQKRDSLYEVRLIYAGFESLLPEAMTPVADTSYKDIKSALSGLNEQLMTKLYPLHALYLFAQKKSFDKACKMAKFINTNAGLVLSGVIYKKNIEENIFRSYLISAYACSESMDPNSYSKYKMEIIKECFDKAQDMIKQKRVKEKKYEEFFFYKASHEFNVHNDTGAINCITLAMLDNNIFFDENIRTTKYRRAILENNKIYYSYRSDVESSGDFRAWMKLIDDQLEKLDKLAASSTDPKELSKVVEKKGLLITTKLETWFKYRDSSLETKDSINHLFKYSIEMGNTLDSKSINEDTIYKDIINDDTIFYCKHIEPLIKDSKAKKYIRDSVLQHY